MYSAPCGAEAAWGIFALFHRTNVQRANSYYQKTFAIFVAVWYSIGTDIFAV